MSENPNPEKHPEAHPIPSPPSGIKAALAGDKRKLLSKILFSPLTLPMKFFELSNYMKILLLGFAAGLCFMFVSVTGMIAQHQMNKVVPVVENHDEDKVKELIQRQEELKKTEKMLVYVQYLKVYLKAADGNMKQFETEIYVECGDNEAKSWIKSQLPAVREIISLLLETKTYEEMLTDAGKTKFKKELIHTLESYMKKKGTEGTIREIYFSQLLLDA